MSKVSRRGDGAAGRRGGGGGSGGGGGGDDGGGGSGGSIVRRSSSSSSSPLSSLLHRVRSTAKVGTIDIQIFFFCQFVASRKHFILVQKNMPHRM